MSCVVCRRSSVHCLLMTFFIGGPVDHDGDRIPDARTMGLASWGLTGADIGPMRANADFAIYTPGSNAGIPLNVVGNLEVPELSWKSDAETMRDEIQGFVAGSLRLMDIDANPISSREHILLSNLVEHSQRNGKVVDDRFCSPG